MKISSRSRHAVTVMLELALQERETETPVIDLARKYGISQSSMEQLFAKLRHCGLVTGRRGRRGGYKLAESAAKISLADIIGAVDSTREQMDQQPSVPAEMVWKKLSNRLYLYLEEMTLAELMESAQLDKMTPIESSIIADGMDPALGVQATESSLRLNHS